MKWFKRKKSKHIIYPFIYIDKSGNFVKGELTDRIRRLPCITVTWYDKENEIDDITFMILNEKYPNYSGGIFIE